MKVTYKVDGEEIELTYYSFNLKSKVKDVLEQLKTDEQYPKLLLFRGVELIDTDKTLESYNFSEKSLNTIYGTSHNTAGNN